MGLKDNFVSILKNIPGKKTNRKIVCIFIDDFGSIRTKDKNAYLNLKKAGLNMDSNRYSKFDTLASTEDLQMLFDVLTSVKDCNGKYACLTPFVNIANPDFDKIRNSNFETYYREPFTETLKKYGASHECSFKLWQQGIASNIFLPAYHGTEHINVKRFMEQLQIKQESTMLGFNNESVCLPRLDNEPKFNKDSTTFYIDKKEENDMLKQDIRIGLKMFEDILGYRSKQFTPGAGCYSPLLDSTLKEEGIEYINVNRYYPYPLGENQYMKKFLFNGKSNYLGQKYLVRNCVFEPYFDNCNRNTSVITKCLKNIEAAFLMHVPAIISTHRVNFVGSLDSLHRDDSLLQLKKLLHEIVKRWVDVEFMTGDEMCNIYINNLK